MEATDPALFAPRKINVWWLSQPFCRAIVFCVYRVCVHTVLASSHPSHDKLVFWFDFRRSTGPSCTLIRKELVHDAPSASSYPLVFLAWFFHSDKTEFTNLTRRLILLRFNFSFACLGRCVPCASGLSISNRIYFVEDARSNIAHSCDSML